MTVSEATRLDAGLTESDLWLRYFELGGMSPPATVESFMDGTTEPTDRDHDVLAQALNERFTELGRNHPVPYSEVSP